MTSYKKYIEAIIRVPIEITENKIHMDFASVDFVSIQCLPIRKITKESLIEKLNCIKLQVNSLEEDEGIISEEDDDISSIGSFESKSADPSIEIGSLSKEVLPIDTSNEKETPNLIEILNLFVQPNEVPRIKKKTKTTSFKKKEKSNRRYTSRIYDFNGR